jgi:ABC-type glycerol-3-phosphate transport system substrate-binding protein
VRRRRQGGNAQHRYRRRHQHGRTAAQHFGPKFVKKYPNVTINVVGTGPGDAGSQAIYTKLKAQKDAGTKTWDIDVAIVHQSIMGKMIEDGLLLKYVPDTSVAKYVISADSKNALGTNVEGYVIPMFHS